MWGGGGERMLVWGGGKGKLKNDILEHTTIQINAIDYRS